MPRIEQQQNGGYASYNYSILIIEENYRVFDKFNRPGTASTMPNEF